MSPHVDVTLAYIQKEINKGNNVILLVCKGGETLSCGFNLYGSNSKCAYCVRRNKDALKSLDGNFELVEVDSSYSSNTPTQIYDVIDNAQDLQVVKELTYLNQDLGYAIVSSLVSRFRTSAIDINKRRVLKQLADAFVSSFHSTEDILKSNEIDQAFVFNGRLEMTRGFFRACRVSGIDCNILEVSQVGSQSMNYKNALPLDLGYTKDLINNLWQSSSQVQRDNAKEFFEKKAKGVAVHDKIYTSSQIEGVLPKSWDKQKKNIVIFGSSADEFYSIGKEWEFPFYKNQYDGLEKIVKTLFADENIHIYFRMHPNLSMLKDVEINKEMALGECYSNLTVITPHNKISTYSLMNAADKVVTFGSSVGIEAAYWGKTSILAGKSMYAHLEGVITPSSHMELIDEIKNHEPTICNSKGALMYSNFLLSRGEEIEGLEVTSSSVTYKKRAQNKVNQLERLYFRVLCSIENLKDWNTFAQSIRDRLPNAIKKIVCNIIQHK